MFRRVVVPVDVARGDDHAIPVAVALAREASASAELLTVVEPGMRDDAEVYLHRLSADAGEVFERRVVETGGPAEAALLAELHRDEESLWCVASHARGALTEMVLGSISEDLVREAHVPVLLVGPHVAPPSALNVLAVALDGTPRSEAILPAAVDLANGLGMTMRLLQVQSDTRSQATDVFETGYLAHVGGRLAVAEQIDYDVLHGGDAADTLSAYLEREPEIAILAIATRGLRGGARLRHGSTAFEVAHKVSVPVLALHALEPDT
jgi:nucleotide-binding universal stress UspA family protein